MNSNHFKHSPKREYPAIELDMTNFMEHLSDEYICGKIEVKDGDVQINPKVIDCKTEECMDLGDIFSVLEVGPEREEKVRNFNIKCGVLYYNRSW